MAEGDEPYSGLVGAYRYAFKQSDSRLFQSYVAVSAFLGIYTGVLLVLAVTSWVANPVGFGDRALLGVVGIAVLLPLFGPVLLVARRYRRATSTPTADRILAITGYGFVGSLLVALVISDPSTHAAPAPFDGIVDVLDQVPRSYALGPPITMVGIMLLVVRITRPSE